MIGSQNAGTSEARLFPIGDITGTVMLTEGFFIKLENPGRLCLLQYFTLLRTIQLAAAFEASSGPLGITAGANHIQSCAVLLN
jgi:hypothetical protein